MLAMSAQVIDLHAYRKTRQQADASPQLKPSVMAYNTYQPMLMWVPVWTYYPFVASPWVHAQ